MKAYGYEEDGEICLELEEATLICSIEEIEKLIVFLQMVKERHKDISKEVDFESCHTHYRDWDKEWEDSSSDFIIVTSSGGN